MHGRHSAARGYQNLIVRRCEALFGENAKNINKNNKQGAQRQAAYARMNRFEITLLQLNQATAV